VSSSTSVYGHAGLLSDITVGYLLSKKEGRTGSPEKPLSGLGALSYRNYWQHTTFRFLSSATGPVTFEDISKATSMTLEDILTILVSNDMITIRDQPSDMMAKRKRAQMVQREQGGAARQAVSRTGQIGAPAPSVMPEDYTIHWDRSYVNAYLHRQAAKGYLQLRPEKLKYTPFLVQRLAKAQAIEVQGEEPDLHHLSEPPRESCSDKDSDSVACKGINNHGATQDKDRNIGVADDTPALVDGSIIRLSGENSHQLGQPGEHSAPSGSGSVDETPQDGDIIMEDVDLDIPPMRPQRATTGNHRTPQQIQEPISEHTKHRDMSTVTSRRNLRVARHASPDQLSLSHTVTGRRSTRSSSTFDLR
jgi:hypothetical protein